jgi:tripartite-type tricarboxylate transporter receptor subunit TctC
MGLHRHLIMAAALGLATANGLHAQDYPTGPINVLIPYAAGGGTDNLVRMIEPKVNEQLGNRIIIENRGGGGGIIGAEVVARQPADGYHVLITDGAFVTSPAVRAEMPYDTLNDFIPVIGLAEGASVLLVHPSLGVKNFEEFVALVREHPGEYSYASGGVGTGPHLAAEYLQSVADLDLVHVPYQGTGPALLDTVAGHVPITFNGASAPKPHVDAGNLIPLAVSGTVRNPAYPDTPTFEELGITNFPSTSIWGVYVPTGTPQVVIDRLETAFRVAVMDETVRPKLDNLGFTPTGMSGPELKEVIVQSIDTWNGIMDSAGIPRQ